MKLITPFCYRLGVGDRLLYFSSAVCDAKCTSDRDPDTRKLWWYQVPAAHRGRRNEITPEGRRKFEDKRITCGARCLIGENFTMMTDRIQVEYRALSPTSEREVFQRVQLGMSLSAAGALLFAFSGYDCPMLISFQRNCKPLPLLGRIT